MYGRKANPHEVDAFIASLQAHERANPSTSTTTTHGTYDKFGRQTDSTSSTVSSGGVDPAQFAEDQADDTPEYASVQAAATYFPMLERAIGATAQVG